MHGLKWRNEHIVAYHAYNMVMKWIKEGRPHRLDSYHWRLLHRAVNRIYKEKKNAKVRSSRR